MASPAAGAGESEGAASHDLHSGAGVGAADATLWHRRGHLPHGQTVVLRRQHQRRREIAELLQALLDTHPRGTVDVAWDNASTHEDHEDDEVEAVVRGAAGRLVRLDLPTYRPWRKPIELLWRPFRRAVTHCELFATVNAWLAATRAFFDRHNQHRNAVLSIIGSPAT